MSVSTLLNFDSVAYEAQSVRCYNLQVDGQIYDADGNSGTFILGTIGMTAEYVNDSYSHALNNLSYTKFGYMVNLQLRNFIHNVVLSGGVFTIGTIPSDIRPVTTQRYVIEMRVANSDVMGILEVGSNGIITLIPPGGTFPVGFAGIPGFGTSITYTIN